ncbi:lysophospholipid acyltransferase family protein [Candidatus Poriferisocius sp.]|uniref:lysophospholipid acyltransferase family protein n=1 Tax=Candidatus Poriferisocius sp. TaxID=3101276 RepID=UPI003B5AF1E8
MAEPPTQTAPESAGANADTALFQLEQRVVAVWATRRARVLYRALRLLVRLLGRTYLRTRVVGAARLRQPGAFIIAPVHRSNLDAPLVNGLCPGPVRSLAKREMFAGSVGTWVSAMLGCYPVQRGMSDRRSLQAAVDVISRGRPMLVFPEGTRQSGHRVGEIFGGTAFLAAHAGVPIVPVGIAGTEEAMAPGARFIRPGPVTIVVGEPLAPPATQGRASSDARRRFTAELHQAMQQAMDQAVELAQRRRQRLRLRRAGRP